MEISVRFQTSLNLDLWLYFPLQLKALFVTWSHWSASWEILNMWTLIFWWTFWSRKGSFAFYSFNSACAIWESVGKWKWRLLGAEAIHTQVKNNYQFYALIFKSVWPWILPWVLGLLRTMRQGGSITSLEAEREPGDGLGPGASPTWREAVGLGWWFQGEMSGRDLKDTLEKYLVDHYCS